MNKVGTRLVSLTTKLMVPLHRVTGTVSARRATGRTQGVPPRQWAGRWRTVLSLLVYAVGYLIAESAAWLLSFALSPKIEGNAPLIVHCAVTVAALLLVPPKRWWIYLVLTAPLIMVNAWLFQVSPSWSLVWVLLLLYLGILGAAVATVSLLRRFVGVPVRFASVREVSRFVLCACGGAVLPACIFTAGRIVIFNWTFWFSWEIAYFGTVMAILMFTPAIVLWATTDIRGLRAIARGHLSEVVLLALGLLVVSAFVFGVRYQGSGLPSPLIYLVVPLLLWAAVRFGLRGIASALALTTLVAITGATKGVGPFVGPSAFANVFALQLFLIFVGVPLFFLAALVQERKEAVVALQASEARYRTVVRHLPHTVVLVFDAEQQHNFAEGPELRTLGLMPEAVEGRTVREAFSEDLASALMPYYEAALSGQAVGADVAHAQRIYHVEATSLPTAAECLPAPGAAVATAPIGLVVLQDVTEQRRARDELERERTRAASLSALTLEFRTLAEHSPDMIARLDPSGRYVYVNQASADLTGLTSDQLVGKTIAEIGLDQHVYALLAEALQGVVATVTPRTVQVDVQLPLGQGQGKGQIYSFHARFIPELDDGGTLASVLVIGTDVSALKQAEARLAEQASELETIFEAQADGVAVFDLEGGFVRANTALRHLLGIAPDDDYLARPLRARAQRLTVLDDTSQPLTADLWPHWRALRGETFAGAGAIEVLIQTLDGREVRTTVSGAPMRAPDGHIVGAVLIYHDVTARRALEEQVAEQTAELEAIFEAIADGIGVFDLEGRFLRANRALHELEGFAADAAYITRPLAERAQRLSLFDEQGHRLAADQWPHWRALHGETFAGASAMEVLLQTLDERAVWVSITGAPVRAADRQITGGVLMVRDVTARRALEQQMAEQAAQLEAIFEAMADGVLVHDEQGRILRVNQAYRDLVGLEAEPDYLGRSLSERRSRVRVVDEQGHPISAEQSVSQRVLHGEVMSGQHAKDMQIHTLDGRDVWVNASGAPIRAPDGQITGAVLLARDVTARRTLEQQMAEQAAQLEAIFEAMTDGVFVVDAQEHVTHINAAAQALIERTTGEAPTAETLDRAAEARAQTVDLGNGQGRAIPAAQLPTVRLLQGEVLTGASAQVLQLGSHSNDPERTRTVSITGGPLRDATGQIVGAVGIVRDVTELQRTQTALANQERQFRTLVEHSPDVIARFDRELRYLYVSPAIRQVLPVPIEAAIGKTNAQLGLPEAAYAPAHRAIARVFQTGERQTLEESDAAVSDPETARYYRAQFLPEVAPDGCVETVLTVTTDITALKRTEQALRQANASVETARREEERRKQIAESLRGVLAVLNSTRPPQEVLQYIARQAGELLSSTAAVIYGPAHLTDSVAPGSPATTLRVQAAHGLRIGGRRSPPHWRLPFANPAVEQALAGEQPVALVGSRGHPHTASDEADRAATIPLLPGTLPAPYQALLVVPIRVHAEFYGCLLLFYTQPNRFTAEDVTLAQAYADQVAQVITNARLQAHLGQEATAAERNRLARELHDTVTQELFAANLIAESLPWTWDTDPAAGAVGLQELRALTQSAYAGLRALLLELRPAALERLPLAEALQQLAAAMSARANLPIAVDLAGGAATEPLLPAAVKVAFYRVAQEALTNAAKYAKARAIRVRLQARDRSRVELEILDDGQGFKLGAVPAGHFGLAMMRERAHAIGAALHVRSQVGEGTQIVVTWRNNRRVAVRIREGGEAGE